VTHLLEDYGLFILFGIIAAQAAGVAGLPGKTSLVAAAILAVRSHFAIAHVAAAAARAVGGYMGYVVGRGRGRLGLLALLDIPGRWGRVDAFARGRAAPVPERRLGPQRV
jgi:membrane protein DedA with SNARE-associated domain